MKGQGIVEYALIGVLLLVVLIVLAALLFAQKAPNAFPDEVIGIIEECAESNTSSIVAGGVALETAHGDDILRCLYEHDVTVNFHGDRVEPDGT